MMPPPIPTKEVVARWVELFNAGDVDGLAALYHDDAINHQVAEAAVEGRSAIRSWLRWSRPRAPVQRVETRGSHR